MNVWPTKAWFGLTRRRVRTTTVAFAMVALICIGTYVGIRVSFAISASRSSNMLHALGSIRLGDPQESIQSTVLQYHGSVFPQSVAGQEVYYFEQSPWPYFSRDIRGRWIDKITKRLADSSPKYRRKLGIRVWGASGSIVVRGGKVVEVTGQAIVEGPDEWLGAEWQLRDRISETDREINPGFSDRFGIKTASLLLGDGSGRIAEAFLTPSSTPIERQAAQRLNLACLTSFEGCRTVCDLLPQARLRCD